MALLMEVTRAIPGATKTGKPKRYAVGSTVDVSKWRNAARLQELGYLRPLPVQEKIDG